MRSDTAIGPEPGPPPPCGCVNDLCRLKCTMSKPMSPGRRDAHDRVEVRAVVVERRRRRRGRSAAISSMFGSKIPSVLGLVSIRQATSSSALARRSSRSTPPSGFVATLTTSQAGHRHRRRVGAVRGVGRQHLGALARRGPRGRRASAARRPARRASRRCGCSETCGSPAISDSARSRFHISSSAPWARAGSCSGCSRAWPGSAGDPLVQARVVLHRARAERVEARVEVEVALRQSYVVAHELGLGHLGQRGGSRRGGTARAGRRAPAGTSSSRADERAAPGRALLEDRAHLLVLQRQPPRTTLMRPPPPRSAATAAPRTSASRSMSARERCSVSATSRPSSSRPSRARQPGLTPAACAALDHARRPAGRRAAARTRAPPAGRAASRRRRARAAPRARSAVRCEQQLAELDDALRARARTGRRRPPSALSACAVQMFDVAFSRRMCCSRVCSVSTKPRRPSTSTVSPAMRPGMRRR